MSDTTTTTIVVSATSSTCNSCQAWFTIPRREHARSPWHVYNLKRQVASLAPISQDIFEDRIQTTHERPAQSLKQHCLFCDFGCEALQDNIRHMSITHGFIIPDIILVLDIESLLGYLATTIHEWHECLFCGCVRDSTTAIQSHMQDKGHCKLNLDKEPELLEFWEPVEVSKALLPGRQQHRQVRPRTTMALYNRDFEKPQRQLARRDEMGMRNIGPLQRQALIVAVKRSQKEQTIASRASEWSYNQKANKQKHDQDHGPLAWAKGGMHNLLPR